MLCYYVSHSLTSTAIYSSTHSRTQLHENVRRFQLRDSSKTMIRRQYIIRRKCIDTLYRRRYDQFTHIYYAVLTTENLFHKTMIRRQLISALIYRRIGIISSHLLHFIYYRKSVSYLECQSNRFINSLIPFSRNTSQFSNLAQKLIIAVTCLTMTNYPKEDTAKAK